MIHCGVIIAKFLLMSEPQWPIAFQFLISLHVLSILKMHLLLILVEMQSLDCPYYSCKLLIKTCTNLL